MEPQFVLLIAIVAIVAARKMFTTWVHAKHGYPPAVQDGRVGRKSRRLGYGAAPGIDGLEDTRRMALLTSENEKLHGKVGRLEERIAVLERIATDPAERTAREIDALR